jgi:DNA recombination protein RmuC
MNAMDILLFAGFAMMAVLCGIIYRQFRAQMPLRETIARLNANLESANQHLEHLQSRNEALQKLRDEDQASLQQAREAEKLALQKLEMEKQARQDWEKQREQFEQAARASVMQAGNELSSKLITDHQRETAALRESFQKDKQQENLKIKEYLTKLQERLFNTEQITAQTRQQNDILWRTFSSPTSTGQLAEVGLENLLKNMGLQPGSDFMMQYTVTGGGEGSGLRPDCVIKLPNNRLVIIDCKASKHVLAVAQARGTDQEEEENKRFLGTMREHLKTLSRKDYVQAIAQEDFFRKKDLRTASITNVMYIPSSAAVELLHKLDPELIDRSQKHNIIIIGPGMLPGLISLISKEITDERKLENQEHIIHEVERLLGALASAFGHMHKVGSSLKTLTSHFSKIGSSFNTQIAPKLRNLDKLGIRPQGAKKLPEQLESYEIRSLSETIELAKEDTQEDADREKAHSIEDYRKRETA